MVSSAFYRTTIGRSEAPKKAILKIDMQKKELEIIYINLDCHLISFPSNSYASNKTPCWRKGITMKPQESKSFFQLRRVNTGFHHSKHVSRVSFMYCLQYLNKRILLLFLLIMEN